MKVNPVELLPTEKLVHNNENPKRPMALRYKRGLRASLSRFGFAGLLVVAENAENGTYEVIDGNTRLDELQTAGVDQVPCVVMRNLSADDRRAFALSHDRNRKFFDEEAVLSQLETLAGSGHDIATLAELTGVDNLSQRLASSLAATKPIATTDSSRSQQHNQQLTMGSFVLYGPQSELDEIRAILKQVKGRLSTLEKARKTLGQSASFLDWSDEQVLAVLLSAIAKFQEVAGQ